MPARVALGPDEERMIAEALSYYRERGLDPGYQGHFEHRYCEAFCNSLGGGYADAVATGTAALFVAFAALRLPAGSEVLVSPITDPGTLSAIILNSLTPRLMDTAPGSRNVGAEQFRARIGPNVKAVCLVHAIGQAISDTKAIVSAAHDHGMLVVEDCSQSHGACIDGEPIGRFGDIAAFSTMYRKAHVTGASGGLVFSRNEDLYRHAFAHADRGKPRWLEGFDDRNPATFLYPALNLHTDEISCAIGIASLARLPETIRRRRAFVKAFAEMLRARSNLCLPYSRNEEDSPFIYPVVVDNARISCDKTTFADAVAAEGVPLNPHYRYLVADWPWIRPYLADDFDPPNARAIRDSCFDIYLNENYGAQEAQDIVAAIMKVEHHFGRA
jgi:dTDP-4-amino-4,6-dideoxygalactose transaminase